MSKIDEIEEKISKLYMSGPHTQNAETPRSVRVQSWFSFSREYINAATVLDQYGFQYILPRIQLTGQAIEAALKAFLISKDKEPNDTHNLTSLYKQCEKVGVELDEKSLGAIVHLNHYYFRDLATKTKYKSRYPTENREGLGGAVPYNETYISIVNALMEQAA